MPMISKYPRSVEFDWQCQSGLWTILQLLHIMVPYNGNWKPTNFLTCCCRPDHAAVRLYMILVYDTNSWDCDWWQQKSNPATDEH